MSTACMSARSWISWRIASVHGSPPNMPTSSEVDLGSMPWFSISSSIDKKYEGVTMMPRGRKS